MRTGAGIQAGRRGAVALAVLLLLGACIGTPPDDSPPNPAGGPLQVAAPAALAAALTAVAAQFEAENEGAKVQLTFSHPGRLSSSDADTPPPAPDVTVFEHRAVTSAKPAPKTNDFVSTQFVIAVAAENPMRLGRLTDLGRSGLRVALCDAEQACGWTADELLAQKKLSLHSAIRVADGPAAMAELLDGSIDAALVYRTDARAAGDKVGLVEISEANDFRIGFTARVVDGTPDRAAAAAFIAFLASTTAQDRFASYGFQQGR